MGVPRTGLSGDSRSGPRDRALAGGAVAGLASVALFVVAAVVFGDQPSLDASGEEAAAYFGDETEAIQIGCAIVALSAPLFVWFFATLVSIAGAGGARRSAGIGFGCAVVFLALFLADVAMLAAGALRPEAMIDDPQLAGALYDLSWTLPAMAAPLGSGALLAFAAALRASDTSLPRWLAPLGAAVALAYALRLGPLFTTEGAFAADGLLGLYVPVASLLTWIALAAVAILVKGRHPAPPRGPEPGGDRSR